MTQNYSQSLADAYYDFISVNENLERAEYVASRTKNGFQSLVNMIVFSILFVFALALAWHFDFESTYSSLEGLRQEIIPSLPAWAAGSAAIITAVITVAPTLLELFASPFARAHISVMKLLVFGFSAFDVITDIPTTKAWIDSWQAVFAGFGPILGFFIYWIAFFIWLLLATIGFQLTVAIFAYVVIIYFRKATIGMGPSTAPMGAATLPKPQGSAINGIKTTRIDLGGATGNNSSGTLQDRLNAVLNQQNR